MEKFNQHVFHRTLRNVKSYRQRIPTFEEDSPRYRPWY